MKSTIRPSEVALAVVVHGSIWLALILTAGVVIYHGGMSVFLLCLVAIVFDGLLQNGPKP